MPRTQPPGGGRLAAACLLCAGFFFALAGVRDAAAQSTLQDFFRPGEARSRFEAWEKRVRKFEAALSGEVSGEALAAVNARLRQVVADVERERDELARRYEAKLDEGRKRMAEKEAAARAEMELGYGVDAVRYADNVASYARARAARVEARAADRKAPPAPGLP